MTKECKKIINIDLDGVLNDYIGYYQEQDLPPIKAGAYEFLESLAIVYEIEIFTARNYEIVQKWIKENNLSQFIKNVTDKKNPCASIFVDDRAITFFGDFNTTMKQILNFKPYWQY